MTEESKDALDTEEFYELMQTYRHSGIKLIGRKIVGSEQDVVNAFEAVKTWVREHRAGVTSRGERA